MFIPRHPVVENQFCQFTTTSGTTGIGGAIAYAGAVCYLVENTTNQDAVVNIYTDTTQVAGMTANEKIPFGFLMQKVKAGYHQVHPAGMYMPGDLGSSDVIAQPTYNTSGAVNGTQLAPVGVAHLGIWDTVHYVVQHTGSDADSTATVASGKQMKTGQLLYAADDSGGTSGAGTSKVTNVASANTSYGYFSGVTTVVARVVKGASAAQCQANINNTTLYPIRIKLLV